MSNTGVSSGTLANGQAYGNELSSINGNNILLGGGELYLMPIDGATTMPTDEEIEVALNNVGTCSSGFKINYKPKTTKVYNQYDQLVKTFITREDFSVKTGIMTWDLAKIQLLSNGQMVTSQGGFKSVVFTGSGALQSVLVRFVHVTAEGEIIRFTMIGEGGNGLGLEFGTKPTTIDCELNGIQYFNNFLAEIRETIPAKTENTQGSNVGMY